MLLKPRKNLIAILDIGSSKIAALLSRMYDGGISVIGCVCKPSQGVKNGIIVDIRKAVAAMALAIEELENVCSENIESVYISIAGCGLSSRNLSFEILNGNNEIGDREIKTIIDKGYESIKEDERLSALHCLPIEYVLDGTPGIVNPYGMYGSCLAVKLHMVTANKPPLINVASCLNRCHLTPAGYIATPYANGFACISNDDKNLGAILIDIGGGTTSIGIYKDNNLTHTETLPIGGINITKDIACAFSLSINVAEKIKILYGSLYPVSDYSEIIEYDDINETTQAEDLNPISKFDLCDVISARVDEIISMVSNKLLRVPSGLHIFRKIVLTGGVSKTEGLREKFAKKFNTTVIRGKQDMLHYSDLDVTDPSFSAIIGSVLLLNNYFYDKNSPQTSKIVQNKGNFVKWIQKHF
ncbi:Cell division protein FtsA [Candidatus Xenohaliotis californiensis]|uniref:Cell division protein FtsA n=1 Tax=Candidatus Xenohaliotis californiensis TaxID=84677 RepID=A0ABP0EWW3_9RICK|nr:Cell division protein FtsA [Candidatus Xenohaliotis californiensis]